jgi:hypothetical protein
MDIETLSHGQTSMLARLIRGMLDQGIDDEQIALSAGLALCAGFTMRADGNVIVPAQRELN